MYLKSRKIRAHCKMKLFLGLVLIGLSIICGVCGLEEISKGEKHELKEKVLEMFDHAFGSYMKYAYPADELMPLSCKGRYRNLEASRGDIDEVLGNYTLTLVDSLDTLALLGRIDDFEDAVMNVIETTHFDRDLVISVFESNIRMLGGLMAGHISLIYLRDKLNYRERFSWYKDELLLKAKDLGERLLPAFNTTTGLPMSRINLKKGITPQLMKSEKDKFTCTACAGTLLLEFVLLSRLTGETVFQEKVLKAMDFLWEKRNQASDLVGTVINVHDGEWSVRDASIGAGIDSYYEYLFKGYILLGDENLLYRFNRHYDSITKYMSLNSNGETEIKGDGSCMKTVHMHMPNRQSRNYIDALLAFWPGIQVLKGDIKSAIKFHENLYQIVRKHDFLPEAVLFDHSVHWSNHPLRPEFLESTYYLYRATKDDHYLQIAKDIVNHIEKHARVKCGYAALSDVKTKQHEDRIDSFFYAETFKYLYLMFVEDDDLLFDMDDFLFSTEAHLIPLNMNDYINKNDLLKHQQKLANILHAQKRYDISHYKKTCPSLKFLLDTSKSDEVFNLTKETKKLRDSVSQSNQHQTCQTTSFSKLDIVNIGNQLNDMNKLKSMMPLRAADFVAGRSDHMAILKKMGINLNTMPDGRVQLVHKANEAESIESSEMGIFFMTEMLELSKQQNFQLKSNIQDEYTSLSVILLSNSLNNNKQPVYVAGPAQFGYQLRSNNGIYARLIIANPIDGCSPFKLPQDIEHIYDRILVVKRGNCMFIDKVRLAEKAGALGVIVIDNADESSHTTSPFFAMSGDGIQDVKIPSVFLFGKDGNDLLWNMRTDKDLLVFVGDNSLKNGLNGMERAIYFNTEQIKMLFDQNIKFNIENETCSFWDYFKKFVLFKRKPQICSKHDDEVIQVMNELINPRVKQEELKLDGIDGTSDKIQIVNIDDSIKLVVLDNFKKHLFIDLDMIANKSTELKNKLTEHEYTLKIFELLYERLEAKTNLLQLKNSDLYTKALYNYVNSKLNAHLASFSSQDKLFFKMLTNELDLK